MMHAIVTLRHPVKVGSKVYTEVRLRSLTFEEIYRVQRIKNEWRRWERILVTAADGKFPLKALRRVMLDDGQMLADTMAEILNQQTSETAKCFKI